jgi:poly-gamma-glutamate synthesis protein (capsule biosynthesis protein)
VTAAPPTTLPPPKRISLLFGGDVLTHGPVVRSARAAGGGTAYDFGPLFAPVAPIVSAADVAVCHLEVPVDDDNSSLSSYPRFTAPREVVAGLAAAGFDGCSTASNHSVDRGGEGIRTTLEVLDAAGLAHAGTGRTPEEAAAPAVHERNGFRVAHLSFTYGTNGLPLPPGAPWAVNLVDPARIVAEAAAARAAGADAVVVSLHWGQEYRAEPTAEQRAVADAIAASGAVELVIGHHAHVPQTIEQVGGTWVVFGLGNFVSNQTASCCSPASEDGVLVRAELVTTGTGRATVERLGYVPIRVDRAGGHRVLPVVAALADPALRGGVDPAVLQAGLERTTSVVDRSPDDLVVRHDG